MLLVLPLQESRPAPTDWLVIDKLKQDMPGEAVCYAAASSRADTEHPSCTPFALLCLAKPCQNCTCLCEVRAAPTLKLLPLGAYVQPSVVNPGLAAEDGCTVSYRILHMHIAHGCTMSPFTDNLACARSKAGANSATCALQSKANFWQSRWNAA